MNSDRPEGKGGVPNAKARRPIHSYRVEYPIINEIMGRYGLNKNNQNEQDANDQIKPMGVDVVDNVMSKMCRQTSPLSIRKKKLPRSNSYSQDEENTDETNVLSKSLPATLPSHLPYSDESEIEDNYSMNSLTKSRIEEESYHGMINRSNRSNRSNMSSERVQSSPYQRKLSVSSRENNQPQSSNILQYIFLTLLLSVIAVMIHWKFPNILTNNAQDKSTQTVNYDKIIFENNMKNLQEKYNIDDNSILKLKTGISAAYLESSSWLHNNSRTGRNSKSSYGRPNQIKSHYIQQQLYINKHEPLAYHGLSTIFSRMDTGSFMFVYNSKTNNFNLVRFEKFADEVAYTAARFLRNDISSIRHTVVESSNLDMQEHGELITRYRDEVDRSGVMLVKEIDGVPSELAMAFHYYCDEYDPLVKRSAIFFTLNMANCSNTSVPKSTHDSIEKCLAKKWKTVPPENMRPLLTRVVDVIIDVTSVF